MSPTACVVGMASTILTNDKGVPFDRPEPPAQNATIEEKLAYIRKVHAFNDAVTDSANRAFDLKLRTTLS